MEYTSAYDEKELLGRVAEGDEAAFTVLVDAYRNKVFSHALTYVKSYEVAEELVQDIFMKVWTNRHRLPEVEQFKNYLFILGRNQLVSAIRKKVTITTSPDSADIAEDLLLPDKQYYYKETYAAIMEGIERMSPRQKEVFTLSRIEHLSYDEISGRLGISKSAVKFHIILALNFLREFLRYRGDYVGVFLLACLLPFTLL
ncbi:MAG TPA: RNA polymerase sigma-70 factor [Puia sp.]|nr:RNA polymerase sigma-70 factor [Puia sp.]